MVKIKFIAILLIVIFINPCVMYATDRDSVLFVAHSKCVWRVYSDGDIEKVTCFQDAPSTFKRSLNYGPDSCYISPDQHYVAVIRNDDLWMFEVAKKKLTRITRVAKPYTNKYLSIEVKIDTWSWDGRKLLYSIQSGDPGSGDDGFDRKERTAKYGSYVYDVKDESKIFIPESTNVDNVFPNFNRVVFDYSQDGTTLINGYKINRKLNHYQIDISRDGRCLVANTELQSEAFNKAPKSQIVKIDLNNYNIMPVTPVGSWGEYQWPKLSPSGKHVLYKWKSELANNHSKSQPAYNIVVDGKNIHTYTGRPSHYSWINDNTIVFTSSINATEYHNREIIIIDSVTGKIKGRHKIN